MGSLNRFDIERYSVEYDLPVLFETGTFLGNGVRCALEAGFDRIYSVEIMEQYFDENVERFKDNKNVRILHGESTSVLDKTVGDIKGNVLFWLDAHFPGADGHLTGYNDCTDEAVRCPMEHELRAIKRLRPNRDDVFIIDDLSIYETGDFGNGPLPSYINPPENADLGFIDALFAETHHIIKLYYDEGYILLLPSSFAPNIYVRRSLSEVAAKAGVAVDEAFAAALGSKH